MFNEFGSLDLVTIPLWSMYMHARDIHTKHLVYRTNSVVRTHLIQQRGATEDLAGERLEETSTTTVTRIRLRSIYDVDSSNLASACAAIFSLLLTWGCYLCV